MRAKAILILLFLLSVIGVAWCQGSMVGTYGRTILALMPDVQRELKLSKDQARKVQDAVKRVEEEMSTGKISFDFLNPLAGVDETLPTILDAAQAARLEELFLQANRGFALADKKVAAWVSLSDSQKVQVQARMESISHFLMSKAMDPANPPKPKELQEAKRASAESLLDILDEGQRKKFEEG
ncbi:MAG TPA: hypothetical protein PLX06_04795, partial [Fimbriimonadaceae bacterium]|nr:hypothetical protein [Fimbriimonadaceae bacterium]